MRKSKIIMSIISTVGIISIPIVAAVSCGASKDADDKDITKSLSYMKNGMFIDSDDYQPIKQTSSTPLVEFLKQNRKIKEGEKIEVQDDVVVLADAYYSGKIQDISTIYNKVKPNAYAKMVQQQTLSKFQYINGSAVIPRMKGGWGTHKPVVELGQNDSLIYIFDDDNKDGRSVEGFKKQIMFEDTSIAGDKEIKDLNKMIGLQEGKWGSMRVPFIGNKNQGVLTSYFGSQNNHPSSKVETKKPETPEEMAERLIKIFPKAVVDKIVNYYKTASKAFIPTEVPFGFIKYKLIGPNAIKVDFSGRPNVTASHIGKVSKDGKKHEWDAELSIGQESEWDAYNKKEVSKTHDNYLIIGKHEHK